MDHGHITPPKPGEEYVTALAAVYIDIHFYTKMLSFFRRINVSFIDKDGEKYDFQVSEGDNLLDIAQANDLEMEGLCLSCYQGSRLNGC